MSVDHASCDSERRSLIEELDEARYRAERAEAQLAAVQAEAAGMRAALEVIHLAADAEHANYWPLREWLDARDIFSDDTSDHYLFAMVAKAALAKAKTFYTAAMR